MDSSLPPANNAPVSPNVIDQLARTKGWTRLMSVMLWIVAGFMILGGLVMFVIGGTASFGTADIFPGLGGLLMGGLYIALSLIYIYPAIKLAKYSSGIGRLMENPSEAALSSALNEQRAFWKYVGIWVIVMFALYAVAIVGGIAVAIFGAVASEFGNGVNGL